MKPGALAMALAVGVFCWAHASEEHDIDEGIRNLGNAVFKQREEATALLWQHGEAALPRLEEAAKGEDPEVVMRANSLLARVRMGLPPGASEAAIAFAEKSAPADEDRRRSLLASAPDEPVILGMLPRLFGNENDVKTERRRFIQKLGQGSHVEALIPILANKEEDDEVRSLVAEIFGQRGYTEAIPHLVEVLGEERIRSGALCLAVKTALAALGKKGLDGICECILSTRDPAHRANLIWSLMREDAVDSVPVLTDCLRDNNADVRRHAISALQQIEGGSAAPKLLPFLDDAETRGSALLALEKLANHSFNDNIVACRKWWETELKTSPGKPDAGDGR